MLITYEGQKLHFSLSEVTFVPPFDFRFSRIRDENERKKENRRIRRKVERRHIYISQALSGNLRVGAFSEECSQHRQTRQAAAGTDFGLKPFWLDLLVQYFVSRGCLPRALSTPLTMLSLSRNIHVCCRFLLGSPGQHDHGNFDITLMNKWECAFAMKREVFFFLVSSKAPLQKLWHYVEK